MTTIVVGAGLAGLAAAAHLRAAGQDVLVLEREDVPGGRNGQLHQDGFTFDTGPAVLTMVDLIEEVLGAVGSSVEERLDLTLLDPAYRGRFADGSTMYVRHGHEAMRAEIERACGPADAAAFDDFVPWLRRLYELEMPHFIDANFDSPLDLVRKPLIAADLVRQGGFGRLGPAIRRRFSDDRLHRLFSFQALYAGLAPDQALAIYAVITYMDSIEGVLFPAGGMRAVPEAMAGALTDAGVDIAYGRTVTRVLTRHDGVVAGVELEGGEKIAADAVVTTLDLPVAYATHASDLTVPRVLRRAQYSPSAVVWHLGVRGEPQDAAHHNIHFGDDWTGAFDDLLTHGRRMVDPSRLVCVHSMHDDTAAPDGCSTLYVLEPVPNLEVGDIDWDEETPRMKEDLLTFLDDEGYPTDIVTDAFVTPLDWRDQGMAAGTPFALAHTFSQTGPFRPANHEPRRPGLFFAGSGTVPGVGVPMVLVSGKLAAARVLDYLA
ncbi:MAG: phytoene desaturase family protein [Mobilicoccus sp.]|nr:phytoene desaturase family protein [Mobilicoccus sp.]